jgi:hypothetical protein
MKGAGMEWGGLGVRVWCSGVRVWWLQFVCCEASSLPATDPKSEGHTHTSPAPCPLKSMSESFSAPTKKVRSDSSGSRGCAHACIRWEGQQGVELSGMEKRGTGGTPKKWEKGTSGGERGRWCGKRYGNGGSERP